MSPQRIPTRTTRIMASSRSRLAGLSNNNAEDWDLECYTTLQPGQRLVTGHTTLRYAK